MLGSWKALVVQLGMTLLITTGVVGFLGCCCIPLIRSLCTRAIDAAVNKKLGGPLPLPYEMQGLLTDSNKTEGGETSTPLQLDGDEFYPLTVIGSLDFE